MRPINSRERRIQFTRFLLLFLLAVLPIVILVWLHGRVDHMENDFLREQYSSKLEETQDREKFEKVLNALVERADALEKKMVESEGALASMTGNKQDGEIRSKSKDLEAAIEDFQTYASGSPTNKALSDVAKVLLQSTSTMVEVYKSGHDIVGKSSEELERLKEEKKETEEDLKECKENSRLQGLN